MSHAAKVGEDGRFPWLVEITDLSHQFGTRQATTRALANVSLRLSPGEFVALVGPSGCGKSTILNIVAGLVAASSGEIRFATGRRPKIGYVFQSDGLLPWRSALSNIALALRLHGASPELANAGARKLMVSFGLDGFADHYPYQLSGGMRKRVALACAMSYEPELLLMDEPYGALDAITRMLLQDELLQLRASTSQQRQQTILFVTHDLEEAAALADRVAIMSSRPGRIKCVMTSPLGRPSSVMDARRHPSFSAYVQELWSELKAEVRLR